MGLLLDRRVGEEELAGGEHEIAPAVEAPVGQHRRVEARGQQAARRDDRGIVGQREDAQALVEAAIAVGVGSERLRRRRRGERIREPLGELRLEEGERAALGRHRRRHEILVALDDTNLRDTATAEEPAQSLQKPGASIEQLDDDVVGRAVRVDRHSAQPLVFRNGDRCVGEAAVEPGVELERLPGLGGGHRKRDRRTILGLGELGSAAGRRALAAGIRRAGTGRLVGADAPRQEMHRRLCVGHAPESELAGGGGWVDEGIERGREREAFERKRRRLPSVDHGHIVGEAVAHRVGDSEAQTTGTGLDLSVAAIGANQLIGVDHREQRVALAIDRDRQRARGGTG